MKTIKTANKLRNYIHIYIYKHRKSAGRSTILQILFKNESVRL